MNRLLPNKQVPAAGLLDLRGFGALDRPAPEALFDRARPPSALGGLGRRARGSLLAGVGLLALRPFLRLLDTPLRSWRSKRFGAGVPRGVSEFGFGFFALETFPFEISHEIAFGDLGPCVFLNYDVPGNPKRRRGIRCEFGRSRGRF